MFEKYSLTYAGAIASAIAAFTILTEAEALTFVNAVIVVVTTLVTLYGRWRKGDVTLFGLK